MGTIKVSALTAATSLQDSQEFLINESGVSKKISGLLVKRAVGLGSVGYAQVTATQGPITTITDISGLELTVTIVAGRRYRITAAGGSVSSVATDTVAIYIREGSTQLQAQSYPTHGSQSMALGPIQVILTPTAGSHTYKISCARTSGSGNITFEAAAILPAFILIEDIGT